MESRHNEVELGVLGHDPFSNGERPISPDEGRRLIASGYYRKSTGAPFQATHYRRSLDDGSCLHLVIDEAGMRLHHDAFDPHASPFSFGMHVTHEAKAETVTSIALAWSLVKLLAR